MNNNPFELDFNNFIDRKNYQFDSIKESFESSNFSEKNAVVERETIVENKLRELFKRHSINQNQGIGNHPDFQDLAYTNNTKNQYICPLFIDIKDSTRLGLKYDLKFVTQFKNAVIQMCIEVVRAFDGYVHRIMGDAVLVFFGSSSISEEQSILDALTAISMLDFYLINSVKPWLAKQQSDFDDNRDFGFRIGCNFGNDDEVLWSNFGYGLAGEVSPTGFPIDIASKLQSLANKNTTMLGQGLLDKINFPKDFSDVKTDYKDKQYKIVTPNYLLTNGNQINYKMRIFNINSFLQGVLIDPEIKKNYFNSDVIPNSDFTIEAEYLDTKTNTWSVLNSYIVIPKNSKIKVSVSLTPMMLQGKRFKVSFFKINQQGYNDESSFIKNFLEVGLTESPEVINLDTSQRKYVAEFKRDCIFKGIHRVKCEVKDNRGSIVYRNYINVAIE